MVERDRSARSKLIRRCCDEDFEQTWAIINDGGMAYRGAIPDDCWHQPYMSRSELLDELAQGVQFWGYEENGVLIGVMGFQDVKDAALIRHAYVLTKHQGRKVGAALLEHLIAHQTKPIFVGTWAAATWAIRFYERHGFRLVDTREKNELIDAYWKIFPRQRETSVVLRRTA